MKTEQPEPNEAYDTARYLGIVECSAAYDI